MDKRKEELGKEKISKLLVKYSTPAIIGMVVNSLYNLADAIFIGHGAGTLALGGLAISFPIQMIILAFATAVGIGTASIISRSLGSGDEGKANRAAGNSFFLVIIIGFIVLIFGLNFLVPMLRLFGATADSSKVSRFESLILCSMARRFKVLNVSG